MSRCLRAKKKKSPLAQWVLTLSQLQLSRCFTKLSQNEHWTTVKDILLFHSVTSSNQKGMPLLLLLNLLGKPVLASETPAHNNLFDVEMNPDIYKLKYFERELINSLWVTLKLNCSQGGDFCVENPVDLLALMVALSDGNSFTRKPVLFRGQHIVPWLQELTRFTVGQYIVGMLENELWNEWTTSGSGTVTGTGVKTAIKSSDNVKVPKATMGASSNSENAESCRNIIEKALISLSSDREDCIGRHRLNGDLNQKKTSKKIQSHNGIVHEFVQSFLDIMKSKDHEKLSFIVGTSQKRCNSGHNSPTAIKFFKSNIEAVKLWTIIYLLESRTSFRTSSNFRNTIPKCSETKNSDNLSDRKNNSFMLDRKNFDCHSGTSSSRFARMADSIICVPYQESLTPVHELRAIFCSRLLVVGANCLALELIEDEETKSETVKINKNRKKSKKKSKSTALVNNSHHNEKNKIPRIDGLSSSPSSAAQSNVLDTVLPLNISMSPHLLTHRLVQRSEACIFIGRLVDEIVDSASVYSGAKSSLSDTNIGDVTNTTTGTIAVTVKAAISSTRAGVEEGVEEGLEEGVCTRKGKAPLRENNSASSPVDRHDDVTIKICDTIATASIKKENEKSVLCGAVLEVGGDRDGGDGGGDFYFTSSPSRSHGATSDSTHKTENTCTSNDSLSPSSKLSVSPPGLGSGYRWSDMVLYPVLEKYRAQNTEDTERQEFTFIKGKGMGKGKSVCVGEGDGEEEEGEDRGEREGSDGCLESLTAPSNVFGGWAFDDTLGTSAPLISHLLVSIVCNIYAVEVSVV